MGNTDKTNIWKLCKALKEIIGYYDFFGNIIKLLFIKYISTYPDKLPIYDMEDWKRLMEFSRVLDEARFGNNLVTPGDVKVAFDAVDKWKRNSNVHLSGAIDSMKFFFDPHQQRDILYILGIAMLLFSDTMIAESDFVGNPKTGWLILPTYYLCHILVSILFQEIT